MYTQTYTYPYTYIPTHGYIYAYVHIHMHTYTYVYTYTYAHMNIYTSIYMSTYIYRYIHTYIYACTHIHVGYHVIQNPVSMMTRGLVPAAPLLNEAALQHPSIRPLASTPEQAAILFLGSSTQQPHKDEPATPHKPRCLKRCIRNLGVREPF